MYNFPLLNNNYDYIMRFIIWFLIVMSIFKTSKALEINKSTLIYRVLLINWIFFSIRVYFFMSTFEEDTQIKVYYFLLIVFALLFYQSFLKNILKNILKAIRKFFHFIKKNIS